MKKLFLGLALLCFVATSSYASFSTLSTTTVIELVEDGDCDKCGEKDCTKKACKATADAKKKCSAKKACCAKKAEAKKACCAKGSEKKCCKSSAKKGSSDTNKDTEE